MAIKVRIVSFVSSSSPSGWASILSPASASGQCASHNVFIDSFLKGMEKNPYILFLSLWVCKYPLPCFCWPTPPIKSHLSKKPPLTLSACLHSLPVFSVYSYWFPHSLSPFSFLDFLQSQWLVSEGAELKKHEWEKPVRAKKERRCPTTARKVARRRKSKKNRRGGEKDGNRHRCAEVLVKKRGYDWALPRVMQTTFYLLQKQAGGRRSANKHHIQNLVARNIFFPPMQWWLSIPCCQTHLTSYSH